MEDLNSLSQLRLSCETAQVEITEAEAVSITQQTTTGAWTSVEVTEAFCHRAAVAHQMVNCLHEIFFDEALATAKALDAYFVTHGKPLGPLHGLPVSLKDQFHIKGVETTMGYVGWIGTFEGKKDDPRARTFESELVKELRGLGAVLFCKTSVPTTLMAGETANNIIGYTSNPTNRHLSSGGSSGGEGALIALRGSPAGFGTDIGGSIRVPASFNGIFGLRPSGGRLPYEGVANSMDGQNTILSVIGPMATTARSLKLLFKSILEQGPWNHDPLVHEIPWRSSVESNFLSIVNENPPSLTFAFLHHDGVVRPDPPVSRAVRSIEEILRRQGHEVSEYLMFGICATSCWINVDVKKIIDWCPPSHSIAHAIAKEAFHMDGGEEVLNDLALSGEPQLQQCFVVKAAHMTALQISDLNIRKRRYQKAYLDYWNSTSELTRSGRPVDAIICPTAPHAAVIPGCFRHVGYTSFVNVLDLTSAVFPVTHADKDSDLLTPTASAGSLNHQHEDMTLDSDYNASIYDGAPVGLQLIGRRLEEEKVLCLTEYVSRLWNKLP
ncbi:hypothetical protein N7452_001549 [Penicillium brevicompactum]|uniref:amidase n=1 Tax=Penicillium brevicompactum TaxID=5074 RepID=A0A9W9R455_PENBR|nr:hypothetical protein N7452_001549 [Penicillium brevicompactum]